MRRWAIWVAVAALALSMGVALRFFGERDRSQALQQLREISLANPDGTLGDLSRWQGKVLVVNFWATWCAPCREEIPTLMRVQDKTADKGVQIVGIGLDDAAKIREFAKTFQIRYPIAIAGFQAVEVMRRLGNTAGGLPFTVVLDRQGRLVASQLGALTEERLEALLRPLLSS